jgi:hypothetical protein
MEGFRGANTTPGTNRTLQVWLGDFSSREFARTKLIDGGIGTIITDDRGNYDGPVLRRREPAKLPRGGPSGVFVVIEGGGRALFLSEYLYKE